MKYWLVGILVLGLFFFGCTSSEKKLNYAASDASALFVHSAEYTEENIDQQTNIAASGAIKAALTSQPETLPYADAGAKKTLAFLTCLNSKGVTKTELYQSKTDAFSVGVYAVGKEDASAILSCAAIAIGQPFAITGPDKYGLCGAKLTVRTTDENKFHIVFLGTSEKMCKVFCDSQVNGCSWSSDVGAQWIYKDE